MNLCRAGSDDRRLDDTDLKAVFQNGLEWDEYELFLTHQFTQSLNDIALMIEQRSVSKARLWLAEVMLHNHMPTPLVDPSNNKDKPIVVDPPTETTHDLFLKTNLVLAPDTQIQITPMQPAWDNTPNSDTLTQQQIIL